MKDNKNFQLGCWDWHISSLRAMTHRQRITHKSSDIMTSWGQKQQAVFHYVLTGNCPRIYSIYSVQTLLSSQLLFKNLKIKIYKPIILPFLLYGCKARFLTLRGERRPRVFENRILRRIFGSTRDANGEWGRLHNEELHSLYRSPRRLTWARHVARMEEGKLSLQMNS